MSFTIVFCQLLLLAKTIFFNQFPYTLECFWSCSFIRTIAVNLNFLKSHFVSLFTMFIPIFGDCQFNQLNVPLHSNKVVSFGLHWSITFSSNTLTMVKCFFFREFSQCFFLVSSHLTVWNGFLVVFHKFYSSTLDFCVLPPKRKLHMIVTHLWSN